MALGSQRDHSYVKTVARRRRWEAAACILMRRRRRANYNASISQVLFRALAKHQLLSSGSAKCILKANHISLSDFSFNFNGVTHLDCLRMYGFEKDDLYKMIDCLGWLLSINTTKRNRYACDPVVVTCIIMRRISSPPRWSDMEIMFARHASQLSEIFWEGLEKFLSFRKALITEPVSQSFLSDHAVRYSNAILSKSDALKNCVGFMDGTVIAVARPGDTEAQKVAYDGHQRKHALKYQAVTTPD